MQPEEPPDGNPSPVPQDDPADVNREQVPRDDPPRDKDEKEKIPRDDPPDGAPPQSSGASAEAPDAGLDRRVFLGISLAELPVLRYAAAGVKAAGATLETVETDAAAAPADEDRIVRQ